jgi:phosphoserine aminotransferase
MLRMPIESHPVVFQNRFNFSGGPGALPESVLAQAQAAIGEVPEVGLSVLGISHRSKWFREIVDEAEDNFRSLLQLPPDYRVLFLQGGSSLQFSMIAMSLLRGRKTPADYIVSGYWSRKSVLEAQREGPVQVMWSGEAARFTRLPSDGELNYRSDAPYFHYVSNETVEGLQFHRMLGAGGVPRICDMSSDFLCRPIQADQFSMMYAHAQKNLGPSGATVVILRDDLLRDAPRDLPAMLDYRTQIEHASIYNTPPVFAIYVILLVTRWLRDEIGGLQKMAEINRIKARRLYAAIDSSGGFYAGRAATADRSWMNVAFNIRNPEWEADFLKDAQSMGFHGLEGHRTIGGLRASLYNAVTLEAVDALCSFMEDFQSRHAE